jgi:hypothetical protein
MITLSLIDGARRDNVTLTLSGETAQDQAAVVAALATLRRDLPSLPEDPYLLYADGAAQSNRETVGRLPSAAGQAIDDVTQAAAAPTWWACLPADRSIAASPAHSARATGMRSMRSCSTGRCTTPPTRR